MRSVRSQDSSYLWEAVITGCVHEERLLGGGCWSCSIFFFLIWMFPKWIYFVKIHWAAVNSPLQNAREKNEDLMSDWLVSCHSFSPYLYKNCSLIFLCFRLLICKMGTAWLPHLQTVRRINVMVQRKLIAQYGAHSQHSINISCCHY